MERRRQAVEPLEQRVDHRDAALDLPLEVVDAASLPLGRIAEHEQPRLVDLDMVDAHLAQPLELGAEDGDAGLHELVAGRVRVREAPGSHNLQPRMYGDGSVTMVRCDVTLRRNAAPVAAMGARSRISSTTHGSGTAPGTIVSHPVTPKPSTCSENTLT